MMAEMKIGITPKVDMKMGRKQATVMMAKVRYEVFFLPISGLLTNLGPPNSVPS